MSIHEKSQGSPAAPGLRRRVVVELKPDELPLLEEAEARHGSKRAGFLAALQAIGRVGELEARLAELEQRDAAGAKDLQSARELRETVARLERDLATAKEQGKQDARGVKVSAKAAKAAKDAQVKAERARELERQLASLEELVEEHEGEIEQLAAAMPRELFCARCGEWADESEWVWRESEDGELAFHEPCGDHGPGLLGASSWLAYRPLG